MEKIDNYFKGNLNSRWNIHSASCCKILLSFCFGSFIAILSSNSCFWRCVHMLRRAAVCFALLCFALNGTCCYSYRRRTNTGIAHLRQRYSAATRSHVANVMFCSTQQFKVSKHQAKLNASWYCNLAYLLVLEVTVTNQVDAVERYMPLDCSKWQKQIDWIYATSYRAQARIMNSKFSTSGVQVLLLLFASEMLKRTTDSSNSSAAAVAAGAATDDSSRCSATNIAPFHDGREV